MRDFDAPTLAAIASGTLVLRRFIWITPRDFVTNEQVAPVGFWNGGNDITLNVKDGVTGATVARTYQAPNKVLAWERVVQSTGLDINSTSVDLNTLDATVNSLVRGYNLRKAPAERHIGFLDPVTHLFVSTPYPEFVGWVNEGPISTPAMARTGSVKLKLVSSNRALTFVSGEKRSDASQRKRDPDDTFFEYAAVMGQVEMFWGQAKGAPAPTVPGLAGTGGILNRRLNGSRR